MVFLPSLLALMIVMRQWFASLLRRYCHVMAVAFGVQSKTGFESTIVLFLRLIRPSSIGSAFFERSFDDSIHCVDDFIEQMFTGLTTWVAAAFSRWSWLSPALVLRSPPVDWRIAIGEKR